MLCEILIRVKKREDNTYGKNLKFFTSKAFVVNASLISSSVTVALDWRGDGMKRMGKFLLFSMKTLTFSLGFPVEGKGTYLPRDSQS